MIEEFVFKTLDTPNLNPDNFRVDQMRPYPGPKNVSLANLRCHIAGFERV